jgi:sugar/nucleoside kinase (ribokinase family)
VNVLAIGNALVDVLSQADDAFIAAYGLEKGSMRLVDDAEAERLYASMGPAIESSGGSAANTAVGVVSLGGSAGFIGRVRDDTLGSVFAHDIRAAGIEFTRSAATDGPPTGRCLVLMSPDAERTMSTFLGAAAELSVDDIDPLEVAAAEIILLEGYLWDPPDAKAAFRKAIASAHDAGKRVAFSLSDAFCVNRFRREFVALIDAGDVDVLFANEGELCALFEVDDLDAAVKQLGRGVPVAAITAGADGSLVVSADGAVAKVPARVLGGVVDTTGAGDAYAAGFLYGLTHEHDLERCAQLGSLAAAEVISHVGPRPEQPLRDLAVEAGLL